MQELATFEAMYCRTGTIILDEGECDVCGASAPCICVDSSMDEYGPGCICQECVDKAFSEGV